MSNVKKAFQPIVEFLENNKAKKVDTIMADILEMCQAKGAGGTATTVHRDAEGNVVAIKCGYFHSWMPLSHVDFGKKEGSASGFNPMCKEGVSNWSKQQRDAKKAKDELLGLVATGEISPDGIQAELERIEEVRLQTISRRDGIGFETSEEAVNADSAELDAMIEAAEPVLEVEAVPLGSSASDVDAA